MAERRKCPQYMYPDLQTPCFRATGGEPCSQDQCPVFDAVVLLKQMTGEKVTAAELRSLFHTTCVMSMFATDSDEYWKRLLSENSEMAS